MLASKGCAGSMKVINQLFHQSSSKCTKNILSSLYTTSPTNSLNFPLVIKSKNVSTWNIMSTPRHSFLPPISVNKIAIRTAAGVFKFDWIPKSDDDMLRAFFSTSSNFNCPDKEVLDKKLSRALTLKVSTDESRRSAFHAQEASFLGLLTSLVKFVLNIIGAILQVLANLFKVLTGERGEKFVSKAKNSATDLKTKAMSKINEEDVRAKYEKTKAVVDEKIPQYQSTLDHQSSLMSNSIDDFNRRMDTELPVAETPEQRRAKFFEIFKDLVKSNKVFQAVTFLFIFYVFFKIFIFFFGC